VLDVRRAAKKGGIIRIWGEHDQKWKKGLYFSKPSS